jgi:hypothetical protein
MSVRCDMENTCCAPVTHTDGSFIYCAQHAEQRKAWKRCRKLKPAELKKIRETATATDL